jgi:hypothetical protein
MTGSADWKRMPVPMGNSKATCSRCRTPQKRCYFRYLRVDSPPAWQRGGQHLLRVGHTRCDRVRGADPSRALSVCDRLAFDGPLTKGVVGRED